MLYDKLKGMRPAGVSHDTDDELDEYLRMNKRLLEIMREIMEAQVEEKDEHDATTRH